MTLEEKAAQVKLVIFDVDGVLSDGKITIGQDGELAKSFHCRDGQGITLLHNAGIKTAIITGRRSEIVRRRAEELQITDVYQGVKNKNEAYEVLKEKYDLEDREIAYIGDDIVDLPVLVRVGLSCAVGDAVAEVKSEADYIASAYGGNGAVRECVELILKAQDKWHAIVVGFLGGRASEKTLR